MIKGIGIDIVEISRVKDMNRRYGERFRRRFFCKEELEMLPKLNPDTYFAGRIAAKEAVYKALSPDIGLRWKEIIIKEDEKGKPMVSLSGDTLRFARKKGIKRIFLSISNERFYVIATAIAEV